MPYDYPFIDANLLGDKPQMKGLTLNEKINTWDDIYENGDVSLNFNVKNKTIIIVDDLYQSGTSIWRYAKYLKEIGAKEVFGVVCVKSLKDSDNL